MQHCVTKKHFTDKDKLHEAQRETHTLQKQTVERNITRRCFSQLQDGEVIE